MHASAVPIYTDGSKYSEGVGCDAVFLDFDVFISLPVVALIFTAELCAIFFAFRSTTVIISSFIVNHEVPSRYLAFIHAII